MLPGLLLGVSCLSVTCKRCWVSTGGSRGDFFLLVARWLLLLCYLVLYLQAGGCSLILLFLPCSIVIGGLAGLLSLFVVLLSGLLLGFRLLTRVGVLSLLMQILHLKCQENTVKITVSQQGKLERRVQQQAGHKAQQCEHQ